MIAPNRLNRNSNVVRTLLVATLLQTSLADRAFAWGAGGGGGPISHGFQDNPKNNQPQKKLSDSDRDLLRRFKDAAKRVRADERFGESSADHMEIANRLRDEAEKRGLQDDPIFKQAMKIEEEATRLGSGHYENGTLEIDANKNGVPHASPLFSNPFQPLQP